MTKNEKSLTLKLPKETHHKLKMMAAANNKSMTDVIIDFVDKANIKMPSFMQKGKKPVTDVNKLTADMEEIKKSILTWKDEGLTYQAIADRFTEQGTPTTSGRGSWNKGSISNLLKKWAGGSDG